MMFFAYPDPWVLLLYLLIVLAFLGVALCGAVVGFQAVFISIEARWRPHKLPKFIRRPHRYGWRAVSVGGFVLAVCAWFAGDPRGDLRSILIAEPALFLGGVALILAPSSRGTRLRVVEVACLVAWIGLAIAAPIILSDLQSERAGRRTIAEVRERLAGADEIMAEGYDRAVRSKAWSVSDQQTREWARLGLADARAGLRAVDRLYARTTDPRKRRELDELRDGFLRQRGRYEDFVRGLGDRVEER